MTLVNVLLAPGLSLLKRAFVEQGLCQMVKELVSDLGAFFTLPGFSSLRAGQIGSQRHQHLLRLLQKALRWFLRGKESQGMGQAVQASWRVPVYQPFTPADRQGTADSRGQGVAPEGQVPAGSAEPNHPASRIPGKGDPAAQ